MNLYVILRFYVSRVVVRAIKATPNNALTVSIKIRLASWALNVALMTAIHKINAMKRKTSMDA